MEQEKYNNLKLGEKGAILSIVAYLFLSVIKLYVGYEANSVALRADGFNNATDIVASLISSFIMMAVGLQVWVSVGAVIGIIGSQFKLPWQDPLVAVLVGG